MRVVYSPLDALSSPGRTRTEQVVFFGIGFETTAPANAMTVYQAKTAGRHELLPAGVATSWCRRRSRRSWSRPTCRVQAFLAAGHVCTVMGTDEYPPLCEKYRVPIVVTGFEPLDILEGIRRTVLQLESGRHELENAYPRAVRPRATRPRKAMLEDVFEVTDRAWRGIGMIPSSGWRLSDALPRVRRRAPVRGHGHPHRGVGGLPLRRGAAGPDQAARVRGVRQRCAPRATRWARRWSRPRARARRTTCTGGWRLTRRCLTR